MYDNDLYAQLKHVEYFTDFLIQKVSTTHQKKYKKTYYLIFITTNIERTRITEYIIL